MHLIILVFAAKWFQFGKMNCSSTGATNHNNGTAGPELQVKGQLFEESSMKILLKIL